MNLAKPFALAAALSFTSAAGHAQEAAGLSTMAENHDVRRAILTLRSESQKLDDVEIKLQDFEIYGERACLSLAMNAASLPYTTAAVSCLSGAGRLVSAYSCDNWFECKRLDR